MAMDFKKLLAKAEKDRDRERKAEARAKPTLGYLAHLLTEAMSHRHGYVIALHDGRELHGYPVRRTTDKNLEGRGSTLVFELANGDTFRLIDVAGLR